MIKVLLTTPRVLFSCILFTIFPVNLSVDRGQSSKWVTFHVGRIGGEEFLIVASGSRGLKQEVMFERFCEHVRNNKISTEKGDISITVSIGVAQYTGVEDFDTLLAAADKALYHAKKIGRDRVVCAGQ